MTNLSRQWNKYAQLWKSLPHLVSKLENIKYAKNQEEFDEYTENFNLDKEELKNQVMDLKFLSQHKYNSITSALLPMENRIFNACCSKYPRKSNCFWD